jgi:hypothetical protein
LKAPGGEGAPLRAGLHAALLQLGDGLGVLRVAVTVLAPQGLVGADIHALGRVQLVAWRGETQRGNGRESDDDYIAFTFRAFSRRFYPKRLTISTFSKEREIIYRCRYSKDVHRTILHISIYLLFLLYFMYTVFFASLLHYSEYFLHYLEFTILNIIYCIIPNFLLFSLVHRWSVTNTI